MELQSHKISFSLSRPQLKLLRALFCSTVELKLKLELELRKSRRSSFSSDEVQNVWKRKKNKKVV